MGKHNYTQYAAKVNEKPAVVEEKEVQVVTEEPEVVDIPEVVEEVEELKPVEDEVAKIGVVANCKRLNVREHPGLDADVLGVIAAGDELMVYEKQSVGDFYKVVTESGYNGYCVKKYIEIC